MKVVGLDLETTGFDAAEGHRIVEVCLLTYDLATGSRESTYVQRVDPERSIPAAASAVHGIMYEDLVGMPKWSDVAPLVQGRLAAASLAVIHNAGFDIPFIGHELLRVGLSLPTIEVICTMEGARWATPDGKYPKLEELCFALGVPFDRSKAHGALYDVTKMMESFFAGLNRGFFQLPASLTLKEAA